MAGIWSQINRVQDICVPGSKRDICMVCCITQQGKPATWSPKHMEVVRENHQYQFNAKVICVPKRNGPHGWCSPAKA